MARATEDLHYLLSRGYGDQAALKIVGDRFRLVKRQRDALQRIASPQHLIDEIRAKEVTSGHPIPTPVLIDGFNLLILAEVIVSQGFVFECLDGTYRDIASLHGSYRRIAHTGKAVSLIADLLISLGVTEVIWYLDRPVSNSGRLRQLLEELAALHHWPWRVVLRQNVDQVLTEATDGVVVTSDRVILAGCMRWLNVSGLLVQNADNPHLVRLADLGVALQGY